MTVAEMSVDELESLIRRVVDERLAAALDDDEGPLNPDFEREMLERMARPQRTFTRAEAWARLGLSDA